MKVRDIMQTEVFTVAPGMTLEALDRAFLERGVGGFPVVDDGRLVGIVSRSDVVRQLCVDQSLAEAVSDYYQGEGVRVEGIESLPEIAERVGRQLVDLHVRDLMIPHVRSVAPDDELPAVAARMVEERVHRYPVLAADGTLAGIVTSLDFVRLYLRES